MSFWLMVLLIKLVTIFKRRAVVIDDWFPCNKSSESPAFTRANGNELWVLLIEKAWAKLFGSYENIEAG